MAITRTRGALERGAPADIWRRTLSSVPTVFGRLVYLSGLRAFDTGRYEHHGLGLIFGPEEADRALRHVHTEIFRHWIVEPMSVQKHDLDEYLDALSSSKHYVIQTWTRIRPYRNLVPEDATHIERKLFLADFEALLALLMNVYDVASPDRDE